MDRQKNIRDFFTPAVQRGKRKRDESTDDAPNDSTSVLNEFQSAKKSRLEATSEAAPCNSDSTSPEKQIKPSNTRYTKLSSIPLDELRQINNQYQPSKSFVFPKRVTSRSRNRSAHHSWFADFEWLHYDVEKDALLCFTCIRACNLIGAQKPDWLKDAELAFIYTGFTNWKDATIRLARHESSSFHQKSHHLIVQRESATPINAQLLNSVLKDQAAARTYLLRLISSLRYLCLSGNAVRGWHNDDGNLKELLRERAMDVPEMNLWLSKRDNYTSPQIQNELIEIMAHEVQKVLIQRIKSSPWYSLIVDGTTDVSSDEQLAMCARYTDQNHLDSHEAFLGLYTTDDASAKTITAAIKDVLTRLDLPLDNLRGHCFDGAPVMAGRFNGVQKLLQNEQPKSMYIHCSNHSLDLVLQETAKQTSGVCDAMNLVKDVSNTILDSAKRKKMYDK
ncbi:zinc finger MYM-type protein 1, partial [Halyomorpha halys]|uniref:zinc finger MYM-type protein 1 n=1 Tax=Halyomorpha halys TaxID=286706 RepID=UPI0006D4CE0B